MQTANTSETLQYRHIIIIAIIHRYELVYSLLLGTMTFFILDDLSESHSNNVIFYSMFRQKLTFSRDHDLYL